MIDYISLHNFTSYSIMQALTKPADLLQRAKDFGQDAIAVTDLATMAGLWDSLKAANKIGIKLIAGCDCYIVNDVKNDEPLRRIVLLAKNQIGYKNLLSLIREGYDYKTIAFKKVIPRIDWNLLEKYSDGLVCLTGCGNGILSQSIMKKDFQAVKEYAEKLKNIFGDNLGLELQAHALTQKATGYGGEVDQNFVNIQLKKISEELNIRPVVTNYSQYLEKDHHRAHDVLLAIGSGQPIYSGARMTYNVSEFHVKSAVEVGYYFARLHKAWTAPFIEKCFANTRYFADLCEHAEWIDPKYSNPTGKELPEFPVKDQPDYQEFLKEKERSWPKLAEDAAYLRYRCDIAFREKVPEGKEQEYRDRLNEELDVLEYHNFSSYMLIVADFIEFARKNKIRVGPGRGSVGGAICAYLLGIHTVDPIKYGLIFARFHNKSKSSFPDIDVDFPSSGREKVQEYIKNKYGADHVAHVSNVNTTKPKVYIRDICRTFEFGGQGRTEAVKIGNAIADTVSSDFNKVTTALDPEKAPLFALYAEQYPELKEFATTIAGQARAWSTHAGGLVIGKRSLRGLVPLRVDKDGRVTLEYDKDQAEENGLVKMDTLGISTLDIMDNTYKLIAESGKELPPDPPDFEKYDKETYDLISAGDTFGVYQLGDTAIHLCKDIKPTSILDISHINALVRPSAKNIREDFIKTKSGDKAVELLHPVLERSFGKTLGFGLFEESLLYLAQDVAGWDLHSADRLRKMTKEKGKNKDKNEKLRREFIDGAINNKGFSEDFAIKVWDDVISGFSNYGFNASHSLLYALLAFHTAYLKAHYPLEFLVSNLMFEVGSNSPKAKNNILQIKNEIRAKNIKIVQPDINKSGNTYKIINDNTLMTGFDGLKYMGKDAIPDILSKRPFNSFADFMYKIDSKKTKAPAIKALAATGCLDSFNLSRKLMFLYASDYKKKLQVHLKKEGATWENFNYPWPEEDKEDWSPREKYALEDYYLGEGFSGSVKERFGTFFDRNVIPFNQLPIIYPFKKMKDEDLEGLTEEEATRKVRKFNTKPIPDKKVQMLKGIITNIWSFTVKKEDSPIRGQEMARITIQDVVGNSLVLVVFPDAWQNMHTRIKTLSSGKHKLDVGIAIGFDGSFQWENEHTCSFIIGDILSFKEAPQLPADLKSRKIKLPRAKKNKKIEKMTKEELAEEFENDMINDGLFIGE